MVAQLHQFALLLGAQGEATGHGGVLSLGGAALAITATNPTRVSGYFLNVH